MNSNHLIINDPVYGFTGIPRGLLCQVIAHPWFQRLGRIRQLGMAPFVYPGAVHTRAAHSIGAYHLMQKAFRSLTEKGAFLFDAETEAAEAAILLHDVGHGPFSHVLENTLVNGICHEEISLMMMRRIDSDLHGALGLAIKVFQGDYPKPFLRELICSQLDVDRLDYLCRDSFYTGVREGNIGAARIIDMLDLTPEQHLAVQEKGLYSIENYLMTRRLMYWQVYLHKTALAAEQVLTAALHRARRAIQSGDRLFAAPALAYFLADDFTAERFRANVDEALAHYARLDDSCIFSALGVWADEAHDPILRRLASDFLTRRLPRVVCVDENTAVERLLADERERTAREMKISYEDTICFVTARTVRKEMYSAAAEGITILKRDGSICDVAGISHIVRGDTIAEADSKTYVFTPRQY